ncbi:DUF4397 domain-containing protein [Jatrophihabitans sp. YIM 134969]
MHQARSALSVVGTLALAAAGLAVLGTAPASAAPTATAATAVVRSAHFSPDTAGVDVYLQAFSGGQTQLWVSNVGYGDISQYKRITPGVYVVSMRPHDAPATSKPAISWTLDAKAGSAYTAAAIGRNAALQAVILNDELTPPAAGQGRVRIVQAASTAPSVTVQANGGVDLADKLAFGSTSGYKTVPTGRWDVRATPDVGGAKPVTSSVAVAPGSSSTVVVLDGGSGALKLTSVQDAASTAVAPVGSVNAGGGGTATEFAAGGTSLLSVGGALAGAAALLLLAVAVWSRRRHATR